MGPARQVVILTERQRRILWLLSVGRTRDDIAEDVQCTKGSVNNACIRMFRMLDAVTSAQAVRNGLLNGHIGPYENCGTRSAYRRHLQNDEPVCAACKRGSRERADAEASSRIQVQLSKSQLRCLHALGSGHTRAQMAEEWGVRVDTVKYITTSVYAALGVAHLPQSVRREAALREARIRGLLGTAPVRDRGPAKQVTLTETQAKVLLSMESGATLAQTAERLDLRPGTCSTRLSEAYRRLDVAWMAKGTRLHAALRKARALGLLPEPAVT
jgi:DNA-binding CsgD family transcriptional regulator